jgi:hypothetical protein
MNDDETLHNLTNNKLPFEKKRRYKKRGQTSYQRTTLKITNKPMETPKFNNMDLSKEILILKNKLERFWFHN